jgi:hypothetical protein
MGKYSFQTHPNVQNGENDIQRWKNIFDKNRKEKIYQFWQVMN